MKLLRLPQYWKPLVIVCLLLILRETGGKTIVFVYAVYFFRSAGVIIDPFFCTLLVGIVRLISIIICSLVVDKLGRKSLITFCAILCSLFLLLAGVVSIIGPKSDLMRLLPLVAMLSYTFFNSLGVKSVPAILMGELLPLPVKSLSTSICCIVFAIAFFVNSNIFPVLMETIGLGTSLLMCSVSNVVLAVVVNALVPETKGKSLTELENLFLKPK